MLISVKTEGGATATARCSDWHDVLRSRGALAATAAWETEMPPYRGSETAHVGNGSGRRYWWFLNLCQLYSKQNHQVHKITKVLLLIHPWLHKPNTNQLLKCINLKILCNVPNAYYLKFCSHQPNNVNLMPPLRLI